MFGLARARTLKYGAVRFIYDSCAVVAKKLHFASKIGEGVGEVGDDAWRLDIVFTTTRAEMDDYSVHDMMRKRPSCS